MRGTYYFRRAIFGIAGLLVCGAAATAHAAPKFGVVDVQKVMESLPVWTKAVEALRRDFETKKNALDARQAELKKVQDQLEAKRTVSDPKMMAAEEEKFLTSARQFQMEFMQSQQDISAREAKLKESMLVRIEKVVAAVAQEGDFDLVFESGPPQQPNVVFMSKGIEVTPQVIEAYKKAFGEQPLLADAKPVKEAPKGLPKK